MSRIYVASSWRNVLQPAVVTALRGFGHDVYDFRNPGGDGGFAWSEVDPGWKSWTPAQYREALNHPRAAAGHRSDMQALANCDACLLVLPSGRSASWEFGWAMGRGKRAAVLVLEPIKPELMYRGADILTSVDELADAFDTLWSRDCDCPESPHEGAPEQEPPRGLWVADVSWGETRDGCTVEIEGGGMIAEIARCPTREDAERIASDLRAYAGRLAK